MRGFGKGAAAGLACVGLGLAGFGMGVEESVGAAAVYFVALLLTALLTAVLVQAANAPLVEELETRIRMLREFACCGCGHKLGRHLLRSRMTSQAITDRFRAMATEDRSLVAPRAGDRSRDRLRALERDRVPYEYRGLPVLIPRCAHDEIERLKAENTELREQRNRALA